MILAWWFKPLLISLAVASLIGAFAAFVNHEREVGAASAIAKADKAYAAGLKKATEEAQALRTQQLTAVEASHAQDLERATIQIADGLAARTELERLRYRLSRLGSPAGPAADQARPIPDGQALANGLLSACAERYESVARDAGRYADQVIGLQGFVLANQIESGSTAPREGAGERTVSPAGASSRVGLIFLATQPATEPARPTPGAPAPPIAEPKS